ncbi:MAG TPA: steroid 3-ketoacyl-CoA thiolase [Planctomycetes bacterium]|nr:steroid 3-ketoacyl-CoA thiolase [Planctomycetota bacterium]
MPEAFIVDAVRTPMGKNGGQLASLRGDQLLAECLNALVERNGFDPALVEDVVGGCVTQTDEQGVCVVRQAVLAAGWPKEVPGVTLNRLCGSGQQAVAFAAQEIQSGQSELTVGCGMESMSRVPMGSDVGSFNDNLRLRYDVVPQGISAELIAERWGLQRAELDQFSYESHQKAVTAQQEGRFKNEIVPLEVEGKRIDTDQGPRADTSVAKIGSLRPVFKPDGIVSAGSSSQITDGAAAVLLASKAKADELGLKRRARIVAHAQVGVDPTLMLSGPIPATQKALSKAGLSLEDIDLFEVNEAFASVVLAWQKELGVDPAKVNVNGGAIALGHPLGCTGSKLFATLLNELERRELRYGMVTMCIGWGMGTATIIERCA